MSVSLSMTGLGLKMECIARRTAAYYVGIWRTYFFLVCERGWIQVQLTTFCLFVLCESTSTQRLGQVSRQSSGQMFTGGDATTKQAFVCLRLRLRGCDCLNGITRHRVATLRRHTGIARPTRNLISSAIDSFGRPQSSVTTSSQPPRPCTRQFRWNYIPARRRSPVIRQTVAKSRRAPNAPARYGEISTDLASSTATTILPAALSLSLTKLTV